MIFYQIVIIQLKQKKKKERFLTINKKKYLPFTDSLSYPSDTPSTILLVIYSKMKSLTSNSRKKYNISQPSFNNISLSNYSKYPESSQLATYDQYQANAISKKNDLIAQIDILISNESNHLKSVFLTKLQDYPQIVMHLQVKLLQSSQHLNDKSTGSNQIQKKCSFSSQLHQQQLQECQQQGFLICEYFQNLKPEYFNDQIKQLCSELQVKRINYSEFILQFNQYIDAFNILEEKIYAKVYARLKQGIIISNNITKNSQTITQSLSSQVINLHMSSLIVLLKHHGNLMKSSDYISTTSLSCLLTFYQLIISQISQLEKHNLNPQGCKQLQRICSKQFNLYAISLLKQADIQNVLLCLIHSIGLNAENQNVWEELIRVIKRHGRNKSIISVLSGWFVARRQDIGLIQIELSSLLVEGQDKTVESSKILEFQLQLKQIQDKLTNKDIHGNLSTHLKRQYLECNKKEKKPNNSSDGNDNEYVDQFLQLLLLIDGNKNRKEKILFDYLEEELLQKSKHSRNLNPTSYDPMRFSNRKNIYSLEEQSQQCQESSSQVNDSKSRSPKKNLIRKENNLHGNIFADDLQNEQETQNEKEKEIKMRFLENKNEILNQTSEIHKISQNETHIISKKREKQLNNEQVIIADSEDIYDGFDKNQYFEQIQQMLIAQKIPRNSEIQSFHRNLYKNKNESDNHQKNKLIIPSITFQKQHNMNKRSHRQIEEKERMNKGTYQNREQYINSTNKSSRNHFQNAQSKYAYEYQPKKIIKSFEKHIKYESNQSHD